MNEAKGTIRYRRQFLQTAAVNKKAKLENEAEEVVFKVNIPKGKYDLEAQFIDEKNLVYPVCYVDVEKL